MMGGIGSGSSGYGNSYSRSSGSYSSMGGGGSIQSIMSVAKMFL